MTEVSRPARPAAVYFYGTCLVDLFFPQAGLAGIELLRREDIRVIYPQGQTCCGQPAYNSGYLEEARAVARAQLGLFPLPLPIVVPSGSCAGMLRRGYPVLFAGEPDLPRVEAVAGRVWELTEFLVHVLEVKLTDRGEPVKATWHPSCHALREAGVDDEPKSLLRQLEKVELVPLEKERECCGFGGTFSVRLPEVSAAMVADKADDVASTGATELLSGDCGCLLNIGGSLQARGKAIRARHVAEFLLERTRER